MQFETPDQVEGLPSLVGCFGFIVGFQGFSPSALGQWGKIKQPSAEGANP